MGGSAGGNLSFATVLSLIDQPELMPRGILGACLSVIHPDVIPEEYQSYWKPELLADAALLNREVMMPCMSRLELMLREASTDV